MDLILPFEIGDFAESKTFVEGFRGAWFRSKINDMRVTESGHLEYYLEYIDYTEEANEWVRVFQKNPFNSACQKRKSSAGSQIMLRPPFPKWYRGDQVPKDFPKSKLIASVHDTWKVGDSVEWLCEDCYWTAKVVRLISEDVAEVVLFEPPIGEGGPPHAANHKDLRPALDWSIIEGWTVPLSAVNGKSWHAARLIHPTDIEESNTDEEEAQENLRLTSTHKSSDHSQQGTHSSSKRQLPLSEVVELQPPDTVKGTTAEPSRPSNETRARRYPLRARKLVKNAQVQQK
ncbi:uncharacterized protein [Lolium perenne]|uniref:uncharacterized protein isoform X1 n=2 Tax=Lolium perenne TaxID=4522 RepID=UPI0021F51CCA|nr:uncharacterized protein LOC127346971 isoform X1 [Lolium perenne]XP_051229173.1 uncharacterized protein LOC127346971 isoform X1 [Lolium perenne]